MSEKLYDLEYIRYEVGDLVKEKAWIACNPGPLYGIIVSIEREGFKNADWIDYGDDKLEVYWLLWRHTEFLPSCFVELVSQSAGVIHEERQTEPEQEI